MRLLETTPVEVAFSDLVRTADLEGFNTFRSEQDLQLLKDQIQVDGIIRDPFVVWVRDGELLIVDGFNRYRIAQEMEMATVRAYLYEFASVEEVRYWIQLNQQSRRNLTELQRAYFTGVILNEVSEGREQLFAFLNAKGLSDIVRAMEGTASSRLNLFEWLAEPLGSTESTLRRNATLARVLDKIRSLNEKLGLEMLSGSVGLRSGGVAEVSMRQILNIDKVVERWPSVLVDYEDLLRILSLRQDKEAKESSPTALDSVKVSYKRFLKEPSQELLDEMTVHLRAYLKSKSVLRKTA